MERLLRFNAYAMFSLLFIAPIVLPILIRRATFLPIDVILLASSLVSTLTTLLYCAWIYAACVKLNSILPAELALPINPVRMLLLLPAASMILGIMAILVGVDIKTREYVWFSLAVSAGGLVGLIYSSYCMARMLKTVEYQRPVSGGECVGDCLRILFFPFGIWNIQPRLNYIAFAPPEEMDIFKQDSV